MLYELTSLKISNYNLITKLDASSILNFQAHKAVKFKKE